MYILYKLYLYKKIVLIAVLSAIILFPSTLLGDAKDFNKVFWIFRGDDGKLILREYKIFSKKELDTSDLEFDSNGLGLNRVDLYYVGSLGDWKYYILSKGYAKIRSEITALEKYVTAQNSAKNSSQGVWKAIPKEDPKPEVKASSDKSDKEVVAQQGENKKNYINILSEFDFKQKWIRVRPYIEFWGGLSACILTLFSVIKVVLLYLKRRKLYLLFLGARSTGKTTLYKRFFSPDVRPKECDTPESTPHNVIEQDEVKLNWGSFVVSPVYVDTPGGNPSEQAREIFRQDWWLQRIFRPNRRVWLILFATTKDKVSFNDPPVKKIDDKFIAEQLGYSSLPAGFLGVPKTPKPDLIIICLTKFDIFSQYDPRTKFAHKERSELEELFVKHIDKIKSTVGKAIPVVVEIVSACEGWRVREVRDSIEKEIYSKRKVK